MPYRKRATRRAIGQRQFKARDPIVKASLSKQYEVSANTNATESLYGLQINASTPFHPIDTLKNSGGDELGTWTANDSYNEPLGIDSRMYEFYKYVTVKGCHVTCTVAYAPDLQGTETESLTTGQVTIVRTSDPFAGNLLPTSSDIKQMYGAKTRNFQLPADTESVLTKNAYVSNGYSAKKQFHTSPLANDSLRVLNVTNSFNGPTDPTFLTILIKPQRDIPAVELPKYLKPMQVNVKITYILQYTDPTVDQQIPLPMNLKHQEKTRPKSGYKKEQAYARARQNFQMLRAMQAFLRFVPAAGAPIGGRQRMQAIRG